MIAFGDELKSQWQKVANFHSPPACGNSQGSASGMNPNCQ